MTTLIQITFQILFGMGAICFYVARGIATLFFVCWRTLVLCLLVICGVGLFIIRQLFAGEKDE